MGKFEKGNPGGPGRPPGGRNKTYAAYDAIARECMEKAVRAVAEAAMEGDTQAAKLLFARVWPAAKDQVVEIELPALDKPADLIAAHGALIAAIGKGEVSPEQAVKLGEVLEKKRLAIETADLERRLTALEERHGQKSTV